MWSPTHVQVTVQKARDLLTKGKNGTNDAFVTIALGKEKYQTSVKEKVGKEVEWHEECELQIPKQGNTAEIVLTVLHRNFIGVDEFLGVANIPLADFDVYERPRNRWYTLKCKPGKDKNKPRGELEVKVAFTVKAGSLTDLSKKEKHKSSLGQLSHMAHSVGGSLLSIGSLEKRKGLKKLAKSIGHKMSKNRKDGVLDEKLEKITDSSFNNTYRQSTQVAGDADPGVISEDDDEFTFDDLSHKSSESSLSTHQTANTPVIGSLENLAGGEFLRRNVGSGSTMSSTKSSRTSSATQDKNVDEWEQKLYGRQGKEHYIANVDTPKRRSWDSSKTFLTSQPEEEEPIEIITQTLPSHHSPSSTLPRKPSEDPVNFGESLDQEKKDEDKEKEKEKEMSKLARKFKNFRRDTKLLEATVEHKASAEHKAPRVEERIIIGGENEGATIQHANSRLSSEILQKFEGKSREDLIEMVCHLQGTLEGQNKKVRDLEDYLDNLLLRVMETTPRILQNPYVSCKTQAGLSH